MEPSPAVWLELSAISALINNMAAALGRVPVPLGALACQKDSFLKTLQTFVLSCSLVTLPASKKQPLQTFYELELQDTGTSVTHDHYP